MNVGGELPSKGMKEVRVRNVWLAAVLLVAMPASSHSDQVEQDARVAAARKLIEVTGGGRIAVQVSQAILTSMKQRYPKVPDQFWSELAAEMKAEEFVERTVPIYAKYLTVEEMQQLEAFYETPIGQKVLQALPAIMQESVAAGQQWGQELGERVLKRLKERGYAGKAAAD